MSKNKYGYFQGTEEPTPGKKQYKSDKAIVVQPRFEEPFYHNYDLYNVEGVNGPSKLGPGAGWHHMDKYKSISEFLADKRKHMKDKYKANDSWIEDTKENRQERINNMKTRASLFSKIIKNASDVNSIDFPIDNQINSGSIIGDSGTYTDSVPIGGYTDYHSPLYDFEDKKIDELDFGRDYTNEESDGEMFDDEELERLFNKYVHSDEGELYGLPDGISPVEDLDADKTISGKNPYFGTTDMGIRIYDKMSF